MTGDATNDSRMKRVSDPAPAYTPDLYGYSGPDTPVKGKTASTAAGPTQDLYGYSGPETATGAQPAASPGSSSDMYKYSGGADAQPNGTDAPQGGGKDICNSWHPDYSYSSPKARAWLQANRASLGQPLAIAGDGTYTVQFGDDLESIAARALRQSGATVNKDSIKAEKAAIIAANDQTYHTLDCNPDYILSGKHAWKLRIVAPDAQQPAAPEQPAQPAQPPEQPAQPAQPPEQPAQPAQPPEQSVQPGAQSRDGVIYNHIDADNLYINQGGGANMYPPQEYAPNYDVAPRAFYPAPIPLVVRERSNYYAHPFRYWGPPQIASPYEYQGGLPPYYYGGGPIISFGFGFGGGRHRR